MKPETPLEKLLRTLPKKYRDRVRDLTPEDNLIDDCKYMLAWTDGYTDMGEEGRGSCFPVKSVAEAARYVKDSLYEI